MTSRFPALAALGFLALGGAGEAQAAYIYETIDFPDAAATYANGINADGQVVGEYTDFNGVNHAFTLIDDQFASYDVPGAAGYSSANGMNAAGQIVGLYSVANGTTRAYLRDGANYTNLTPLAGSPFTQALSINDAGHVAGSYVNASGAMRAYYYDGSTFTTLSVRGSTGTIAIGLNNAGAVVGSQLLPDNSVHGFQYANGNYTTLDYPDALRSEAQGINDAGQIGGLYLDAGNRYHGFVYEGGDFASFDMPTALETKTFAINNSSEVVGIYLSGDGRYQTRAFQARPVVFNDHGVLELTELPGITVSANSFAEGGGEPDNAIDNIDYLGGGTLWNAGDHGYAEDPNWLQLDFGAAFNLARVEVRGVYNNGPFLDFSNLFNLWASEDAVNWQLIGDGELRDNANPGLRDKSFSYAGADQPLARYLRYEVVGGSHWSYLGEIHVQGTFPGDANGDLTVDLTDLNLVRNNFGQSGEGIAGDTNGDQLVDLTDLNNVRNNFGASGALTAVPEPAGWIVALTAIVGVWTCGRRRIVPYHASKRTARNDSIPR